MRWVLGYLAALCLLVLIISQSVIWPAFSLPFFSREFTRAGTAERLNMSHDDLMRITDELLQYMRGRRDTMEGITAHAESFRLYGDNFFTVREIDHMADVRMLFDIVFVVRAVAFWLLAAIILALVLLRERVLFILARTGREICAGFLILAIITTIIISFDFGRAWEIFHYIFFFFDVDMLWRLTPYRDLMINMLPLAFFLRMSIFVGVLLAVKNIAVIGLSTWYLWGKRA